MTPDRLQRPSSAGQALFDVAQVGKQQEERGFSGLIMAPFPPSLPALFRQDVHVQRLLPFALSMPAGAVHEAEEGQHG